MQIIQLICFLMLILFKINGVFNSESSWSCDNGDIIDQSYLCDGFIHCRDGSDEIFDNCIHLECGRFRCAYGGCIIDPKKICDKTPDCSDNSDENEYLCANKSNNTELRKELKRKCQGNCRAAMFECVQSKLCIRRSQRCNGIVDCPDGSDETVELCSHVTCKRFGFKCAYGGCIGSTGKCNNVKDCIDGSDEADLLCNRTRRKPWKQTTVTPIPIPMQLPQTQTQLPLFPTTQTAWPDIATYSPNAQGCEIPLDRNNLIIFNHNREMHQRLGDIISDSQILQFSCPPSYNLLGASQTYCDESFTWSEPIPKCTKYCNEIEITRGVSTVAKCKYMDTKVACRHLQPGYVAEITCAPEFQRPKRSTLPWHRTFTCGDDFLWNHRRTPCELKCGQVAASVTQFALGGDDVNVTDVPWHVGIYSNFDNKTYHRKCAGAIITPYLIVTAAHCFWDKADNVIFPESVFSVAAGKTYSDYNNESHKLVQKTNIKRIITEEYTDREGDFLNDLALVLLDQPLKFSEAVRPACQKFSIRTNTTGYVAGWSSDGNGVLKQVQMRLLSNEACETHFLNNNIQYPLQNDKFCALVSFDGDTLCQGDSGGGLYVKELIDGVWRHHLVGIVSYSPYPKMFCSKDGLVVFTDLGRFQTWINNHYNKYYELGEEDSEDT